MDGVTHKMDESFFDSSSSADAVIDDEENGIQEDVVQITEQLASVNITFGSVQQDAVEPKYNEQGQ